MIDNLKNVSVTVLAAVGVGGSVALGVKPVEISIPTAIGLSITIGGIVWKASSSFQEIKDRLDNIEKTIAKLKHTKVVEIKKPSDTDYL